MLITLNNVELFTCLIIQLVGFQKNFFLIYIISFAGAQASSCIDDSSE